MKAPITLSIFVCCGLSSAMFVLLLEIVNRLLGRLKDPMTIEQFLVMYAVNLGVSVVAQFVMDRRKKSRAAPEVE